MTAHPTILYCILYTHSIGQSGTYTLTLNRRRPSSVSISNRAVYGYPTPTPRSCLLPVYTVRYTVTARRPYTARRRRAAACINRAVYGYPTATVYRTPTPRSCLYTRCGIRSLHADRIPHADAAQLPVYTVRYTVTALRRRAAAVNALRCIQAALQTPRIADPAYPSVYRVSHDKARY